MTTAGRHRGDQLLTALRILGDGLEDLLVHLRTADRVLGARTGRVGPTLLGAIESSADALHTYDAERAAVAEAAIAVPASKLDAAMSRLRGLVLAIDETAASLRRTSRLPAAVGSGDPRLEAIDNLLHDALDQRLAELLPRPLRGFLTSWAGAPPR